MRDLSGKLRRELEALAKKLPTKPAVDFEAMVARAARDIELAEAGGDFNELGQDIRYARRSWATEEIERRLAALTGNQPTDIAAEPLSAVSSNGERLPCGLRELTPGDEDTE